MSSPRYSEESPEGRSAEVKKTSSDDLLNNVESFDAWLEARSRKQAERVSGQVRVVGVYPVKAADVCHLVELQMENVDPAFDFGGFTQSRDNVARTLWQVPWMEVILNADGTKVLADSSKISNRPEMLRGNLRVAFFIHELDFKRPLISQFGEISLPQPTTRPKRLRMLRYERPD